MFDRTSPEVMSLRQTVFAARDRETGQLVIGVEHERAAPAVQIVLQRLGVPPSDYRIEVTEPIRFLSETLRTQHRPTIGGVQIHFSNYLCTLGFNVDHAEGRSFITNSHCTDGQGKDTGTIYYQPTSSADSSPIGVEADDPPYFSGRGHPECSNNRRCRYSDAARVQYEAGPENLGRIAMTTGVNSQSLDVSGSFDITSQSAETHFTRGSTLHKVGRTTGWTTGSVGDTCATVNVFGSNIQLLCQTFVHNSETTISGSGDSGSPVFRDNGNGAAELVGILWGGSGTSTFLFSPLANIQGELGTLDATTDRTSAPPAGEVSGSISGRVTGSETGDPIQDVTVSVDGTTYAVTTGSDGHYSLTSVPTGTYSVTASKIGYDPVTKTDVLVNEGTTTFVDFALTEESSGPGGERDPVIGSFDVSSRTTGPWLRVTVQWSVSHPDNALESVRSQLFDGLTLVDTVTSSVSGGSASGEHELLTRGTASDVCLTVSDAGGKDVEQCKPLP